MSIDPRLFDELQYLADQIETSDYFEENVRRFVLLTTQLKDNLYCYTRDPDVLDALDALPAIEAQAYRRSFLEQMLPKARREIVGNYKNQEIIRGQVRETMRRLSRIRSRLGEEDDLV